MFSLEQWTSLTGPSIFEVGSTKEHNSSMVSLSVHECPSVGSEFIHLLALILALRRCVFVSALTTSLLSTGE
ncbi:hypothetical protein Q1695_013323 [Nippostrongylus brasiliensis]|nr:hypothetical protein Q1695_013323 [Nippostrongylus brasiliensis]